MKRRVATLLTAVVVALGVAAAPALADVVPPEPPSPSQSKCNAGNGNGSENCDPGNSAPQNRGGDEVGGICPGNSLPNPGGNNVRCL